MALGVGETIGLVSSILSIANQIVVLAEAAKRNKEKCKQLRKRVEIIVPLMRELDRKWTPDPVTKNMLENLNDDLEDAKALVESCLEKRTWSRVFKTQKKANMFDALDVRMSKSLEPFHIANMLLLVCLNNEQRFFMNVLEKLIDDGACRRLPQGKKKELESSIMRLANSDNMSADTKGMLERIISEFAHGDDTSSVRPGGYHNNASTDVDGLTTEVVRLADSIMQEAAQELWQNRDEIQQLVKAVKMTSDLLRDPKFSLLSRDPDARSQLDDLKSALGHASGLLILRNSHPPRQRNYITRFTQAFTCGVDGLRREDGPDILKAAGKIADFNHFYTHVLPFRYYMNNIVKV